MKKVISMVTCTILLLNLFTSLAFAAKQPESGTTIVKPTYVASCPCGGKHAMYDRGTSIVYSGPKSNPGSILFYGYTLQCSKCYMLLACEYNPRTFGYAGRYTVATNVSGIINIPLSKFYGGIIGTNYGSYLTDPFLAGFEFYVGLPPQ